MKKIYIAVLLVYVFLFNIAVAQNNVGIGIPNPDPSALLELSDNTKGFLVPRMTTAQRLAISSPARALLVYDITADCFYYYSTISGWQSLCQLTGITGPTGPTGPAGIPGPQGAQGIAGATGPQGPQGVQGPAGANGATGPQGLPGTPGATGPQGLPGTPGVTGPTGVQGPQGIQGMPGPTGPQGDTGPQGGPGATGPTGPVWTISDLIYNANGTLSLLTTYPQGLTTTAGAWLTTGNSGTNAATNFIGTTDNVDWVVKTNNLERIRVLNSGNVGINITAPTTHLEVLNTASIAAVYGHSANVGGYLGYEGNITFGVTPQTFQGAGVNAYNNSVSLHPAIYGQTISPATTSTSILYSNVWSGSYILVDNNGSFNAPALYAQLNNTSAGLGNIKTAIRGYNNRSIAGNPGWTTGGDFYGGVAGNAEDAFGIMAFGRGPSTGGDPMSVYTTSVNITAGGYFQGNPTQYAYVALNSTTNRKIIGSGTVSEVIPTPNHGRITLTAPESPEYWYIDYGTVQLVNGRAHVTLDPILKDIIVVDADNPLKVICQPGFENCRGVAVINKSDSGFDIVELGGGTSTGAIDYQIVAKPKTNYGEGRFPQAPGPVYIKPDKEPAAAKTANQLAGKKIFHWPADYEVYGYDPEESTGIGEIITGGPNMGKVKLGDGKYGDSMPADKSKLH